VFRSFITSLILSAAVASAAAAPVAETPVASATKLLRFPDIHGDFVAFCHGGDIWKAPAKGGSAIRLTAHPGQEIFPRFSPDGKWIAFTGQYDGDEQVYVIPAEGGTPRQLTFYPSGAAMSPLGGSDNLVYGWTPDGKNILFRSLRDSNSVTERGTLYTVPFSGGLPKKVGPHHAGAGEFSPDGTKLVYSPHFRDFRAWKRYQGGMTQYLTIFDLKTKTTKRLDNNRRSERDPVWIGDKIYFASDRTGTLNLFSYDTKTGQIAQLTHERLWDVRWASGDGAGRIVFELAGELVIFDTRATNEATRFTKIAVRVPHDGLAIRPTHINVSRRIEDFAAGPGSGRVAVAARGDLFSVPVSKGYVRNFTNSSDAHERRPVWTRDGKNIVFISDKSGEEQIWIQDAKGENAPVQLTKKFNRQLNDLQLSPCGRFISVTDVGANLWIVPLIDSPAGKGKNDKSTGVRFKRGEPVRIYKARSGYASAGRFSPCGYYLAYSESDVQGFSRLYVHEITTRKTRPVSPALFDSSSPVWDPSGKYLWFLSRREFAPQHSSVEWNFAGNRNTGIFAILLNKSVPNPFAPEFDDGPTALADNKKSVAKKEPASAAAKDKKPAAGKAPVAKKASPAASRPRTSIDWDGIESRVVRLPVSSENYGSLSAGDKYIYYVNYSAGYYGRESERAPNLMCYNVKERKEQRLLSGVGGYSLAPDFSHLVFSSDGGLKSVEPRPGAPVTTVKTESMAADSIPAVEWNEMFTEAWRKFRDFFYVRNLHGNDWEAIGKRYRSLLPHVTHRADLSYVLVEMLGELSVSHAYVQGGEYVHPKRPVTGLLGCRFELDPKNNRYVIAQIYSGQNQEPRYRAPLTEPGVDARLGDYVLAIDGQPLTGNDNPYRLLRHRTDPITLTLNNKPTAEGARKVTCLPLTSERNLRYLDFVLDRHARVTKATGGRVGYLHIPDMGAAGAYEFIKWYYPQLRKEGLIIDVRSNGGGNISQWIIMRLNQKLLGTRFGGPGEIPGAYPNLARHGHQVCLINENSGSDGDIFPWYFRAAGIGPLIGKRTWGGVVGISGVGPLLDGGRVTVPLRGTNDVKGRWIIEGHGVDPDIEIENDPKSTAAGRDLQLERGIVEVLKRMKAAPKKWPAKPADPVKKK
jgi:tricorn protease